MKIPAVSPFDDLKPLKKRPEPSFRAVRIVRRGKLAVAEPIGPSEPLTDETVRQVQMELRAERGKAAPLSSERRRGIPVPSPGSAHPDHI